VTLKSWLIAWAHTSSLHLFCTFFPFFCFLHNYLKLAKSRDVNGHVTISLDIRHFLLVVLYQDSYLRPAFLDILDHKDNGVMTLTFLGHVTSSVTWPFDSPYPISYWCCIVTKRLSLKRFSRYSTPNLVCTQTQAESSLRMRDITWPLPLCKIWVHFNFSLPHCLFTMTLLLGSVKE